MYRNKQEVLEALGKYCEGDYSKATLRRKVKDLLDQAVVPYLDLITIRYGDLVNTWELGIVDQEVLQPYGINTWYDSRIKAKTARIYFNSYYVDRSPVATMIIQKSTDLCDSFALINFVKDRLEALRAETQARLFMATDGKLDLNPYRKHYWSKDMGGEGGADGPTWTTQTQHATLKL